MKEQLLIASKSDILAGLDKAMADMKVAALTKKGDQVLYDYVTNSQQIILEYAPTVLSPKKFFFPQEEVLLDYTSDGKITPKYNAFSQVIFGIRPCDLNALKILDEAFSDSNGDPNYLAKRESSVVIGIDCHKECDENCFCYKVGANEAKQGFDIMLYELGDSYLLEVANEKGEKFANDYFVGKAAEATDSEQYQQQKAKGFAGKTKFKDLDKLPEIMEQNKDHPVWEEEGSRCLSCGSCIMVCPTCYCFDVADEMALNLKQGQRLRRWDACMLSCFAEVAGGENFRPKAAERLHHRLSRKFEYLMRKHKQAVCVGCGRCVRACLAEISPKTIVEKITGEKGDK